MFTRSNPLLEKLPHRVRNLILAIVIIAALLLVPELRPLLLLMWVIVLPVGIGLLVALPVLFPPLRRAGRTTAAARRVEIIGFGSLAYVISVVAEIIVLWAAPIPLTGPNSSPSWQTYLLMGILALLPALACVTFVAWFTAATPAAPEAPQ